MPSAGKPHPGRLPRLPREWYRGEAYVFWTHCMHERATGWLDPSFHGKFRELLIHTCARYRLACPVYCLMPDHWHLLWMGLDATADQWVATRFFRKHIVPSLGRFELQDRPHDHVLRKEERKLDAVLVRCVYARENPVRAGFVDAWREWSYGGAVFPGYPDLTGFEPDWWGAFWTCHAAYLKRTSAV